MTTNSKAHANEILRIAFPTKQMQLDPQKIEDMYSMTVVSQLYAKLFRYTPDGQVRPDLVDRWSVSKDKRTYTFQLKKKTFSDGSPVTAQHIANSLKRVFILKAALSSDLAIIKGAQAFAKSNNPNDLMILAQNPLTLKIETEKPTSLLIHLLAVPDVGVLKIDDVTKEIIFDGAMAFSGPYKIKSMSAEKMNLQKWQDSDLDSSNPPQEIEFNLFEKINPDQVASGKITDTSSFMTFDEGKSPLDKNSEWRAVASEAANERFVLMNPDKVPANVRKWMLAKVNTEDFVKTLEDKSIVPAFGFIPNCLPGHLKKSKVRKASELKLDKTLTIKITHGANLPYAEKFKSYLTKVWSHSKLKLEFEVLPVSEYLKVLFQKKGAVVIGARGLDYPEGYSVVTYFRSNIESNFFFVNSKEIDKLIDKAAQELESEKRNNIYETIQEKVLAEATVIPLAFGSWKKYYWSNHVKDVPAHPIGVHFIPLEMLTMAVK
ncbi:MAG: ABC transporter substrate-binding protein [Bdellovibrionaceae bacterium]|nr:ABC transporter substrate-binding protein [Pseudobdellovibrionaceae bacterium]